MSRPCLGVGVQAVRLHGRIVFRHVSKGPWCRVEGP